MSQWTLVFISHRNKAIATLRQQDNSQPTFGRHRAQRRTMNDTYNRGEQLERRLISFASAIVVLSTKLPRNIQGRHICAQILRSGTAAAANYGEARGAESRADFVHKLKVVSKELNETTIWLEIIKETKTLTLESISGTLAENRELCRIIAASIRTARASSNEK
jgi:four helix bundle protein